MCFVDLTKAYDRVRLRNVIRTIKEDNHPWRQAYIIEELNTNTTMHILVNNSLSEEVPNVAEIRQEDSLSPLLFSIIMDRIIADVKEAGREYRFNKGTIKMICYADDAVIVAEEEDDYKGCCTDFTPQRHDITWRFPHQRQSP